MRSRGKKPTLLRKNITEVTSVISHQLKTPLAGIKASLEILLSGDLGETSKAQREYLQLALNGAEKMITLVKNLLDASKIDEKHFQIKRELADFVKIVGAVIDDLSSFAKAKNTTIAFDADPAIPSLAIDSIKIQEVVNNIIYNAIRYNEGKGTIHVRIKRKKSEVVFSCEDNGIGISDKDSKKIFSKFYRSPRVVEIATEGSGLGLFISKAIITQSRGKIWFKSKVGEGTTFYFTLPIKN